MKTRLIALALLAAFTLGQLAHAASSSIALPAVGVEAQLSASLETLVPDDSTYVSAAVAPGGCVIISYIDRAHGNRLHVVRDAGDHVVEVELPPIARSIVIDPGFIPPGPKHADSALIINGGALSLYYTSRDDDDPSGPFRLKRLTMPTPGCV